MKYLLLLLVSLLFISINIRAETLKTVIYDHVSGVITWEGQEDEVPCEEAFVIKIVGVSKGSTIRLTIYNTKDQSPFIIDTTDPIFSALAEEVGNEYIITVRKKLQFRRWYGLEIYDVTSQSALELEKAYAIPLKSETSYLEITSGICAVAFDYKYFKDGFIAGLTIKPFPVSTNSNIGRFSLWPRMSRWSVQLSVITSDLNYRSSEIKPVIFGIKPAIGIGYELFNNTIIQAGTIFGNQTNGTNLIEPKLICSFYVGATFSLTLLESLKAKVPLTIGEKTNEAKNN